jgi:hypothetical protein
VESAGAGQMAPEVIGSSGKLQLIMTDLAGMPEFENEDQGAFKSLIVHFRNQTSR